MHKITTIMAISLGLMACGSGDVKKPSLNVDLSQFEGTAQATVLTRGGVVNHGDSIELNTEVTGYVAVEGSQMFTFVSGVDREVSISLTSAAEDLDFVVENGTDYFYSEHDGSNELVVFNAKANQTYNVDVWANLGYGEFSLTVAEATRSSLGLSNGEFLVEFSNSIVRECTDSPKLTYESVVLDIINFNGGYLRLLGAPEIIYFSKVSGNSFTTEANQSETSEGYLYKFQSSGTYTVNTVTGTLSGTGTAQTSTLYNDDLSSCSHVFDIEGQIKF